MADTYRKIAVAVALIRRRLRARFVEMLPSGRLTSSEWIALLWLSDLGGQIGQTLLAERLEADATTMTRIIDSLVRQNLVERRLHPTDRRVKVVVLTPAAQPLIEQGEEIGRKLRQEIFEGIPAADVEICLRVLGIVVRRLS